MIFFNVLLSTKLLEYKPYILSASAFPIFLVLQIATCTVYNVTPDDTTCHDCHNLQHYLLNTTKYFTSNTQLLFLSGLHHLHTNLITQNVHNISLIGSTTNGTTPDTVIQCDSSVGIVMNNITSLTMKHLVIQNCITQYNVLQTAVLINECSFLELFNVHIYHTHNGSSLLGINVLGISIIKHLACYAVIFSYHEKQLVIAQHIISIMYCDIIKNNIQKHGIQFGMAQLTYKLTIKISNVNIKLSRQYYVFLIIVSTRSSQNEVQFTDCNFIKNSYSKQTFITLKHVSTWFTRCHFNDIGYLYASYSDTITMSDCKFKNFSFRMKHISNIFIEHCKFTANVDNGYWYYYIESTVIIQNTTFFNYTGKKSVILLKFVDAELLLIGPVIFNNIKLKIGAMINLENSTITVYHYLEFSQNDLALLFMYICKKSECFYMSVANDTTVNFTGNIIGEISISKWLKIPYYKFYLPCFFQYIGMSNKHTLVLFNNNRKSFKRVYQFIKIRARSKYDGGNYYEYRIHITHCYWISQSVFHNIISIDVNQKYLQVNNSKQLALNEQSLCYCNKMKLDCYKNEFGSLYPGQTITESFTFALPIVGAEVIVETDTNQTYFTSCIVYKPKENVQLIGRSCTKLTYTIAFPTDSWCELFLKVPQTSGIDYSIFYIRQLPCPLGFVKRDNICKCYPFLNLVGITDCDINRRAIRRSANSWISILNHENIYVSKNCPFNYCKANTFYLNISNSDLQCQFKRSGVLCGHCKSGLSTMFGSFHCQYCSDIYIFLIIPIAIAGLLLVLLLFLLNLTVTDGSINAFILYVNIISINSTVFFPHQHTVSPAYIFISLANFDLGIQTCFYNGMDDYAKMWLQLTFPFYLIFLATLLIITSRYSTTIQRLTANRALPVLATLFLLSYTKILRTVSMVLFFYSSITHLPSQHTTQVWSVDANIPLFGVKFTIIFIVCLLLFLILVLFNFILLFTRTLSRFKVINRFKPLLDAYQGPYKIKFYYWTGLQLAMRVVFFGISSLDRTINLTIGGIILIIVNSVNAGCKPFKNKVHNYHEVILCLNQLVLYIFTLSSPSIVSMTAANIMVSIAAVHFSFIVINHILPYIASSIIMNKLISRANSCILVQFMKRLYKKPYAQDFELQNNTAHLNVPSVTYNYHEYQEPLIGSDYCK